MLIIKGYKVPRLSLAKVETIINTAKSEIMKIATQHYFSLLSNEIEVLVDNIVLGTECEPTDKSIFECAADRLNHRIAVASAKKVNTEYNMSASANLFTYENDTYIELVSGSELYDGVFNSIDGVEDYCAFVQDSFIPAEDPKITVWKKIIEKYKKESVFVIRLYPVYSMPEPTFEQFSFHTVKERAEKLARHHITNVMLSSYSGGEQIPPHKLMEYMDYALLRASDDAIAMILEEKKKQLLSTLPEITPDIIYCARANS